MRFRLRTVLFVLLLAAAFAAWQRVRINQQLAAIVRIEAAGGRLARYDELLVPPGATVAVDLSLNPAPSLIDRWLNLPVHGVFIETIRCDARIIAEMKRLPAIRKIHLTGWPDSELTSRLQKELPNVEVISSGIWL